MRKSQLIIILALLGVLIAINLLSGEHAGAKEVSGGRIQLTPEQIEKYDKNGPAYPHPVIITERCIGCHACVEACPHDVLAIVNGVATPVARDQCMEDTACQVECPV